MRQLIIRWHQSITEISEPQWRILTENKVNPFYQWQWLKNLEKSGSICANKGWQPLHLGIWRGSRPIAVAPLYLKGHSYGEFVFDQVFADLARQLELNYYPKLIGMSPLSPIEGYRFFYAPGENKEDLTTLIMNTIDEFSLRNGILSCNFLYVDSEWKTIAQKTNSAAWVNQKSLWIRDGSSTFSDYLNKFNSNQRRNIKRERKAVEKAGIKIAAITGAEIDIQIMQIMHDLYEKHCSRWGLWGSKYLSEEFFHGLASPIQRDNVVLFSAHRTDPKDPIAMSICIKNKNMLWGRYWGSKEEIDCLHFEVCYYSPITWALDQGITRFDPGAGGIHKRRRGFLAKSTTSLHRWYDKRMEVLIRNWLEKVNKITEQEIEASNQELPFKGEAPKLTIPR